MAIAIDIFIVSFILLSIFLGYRKGLTKALIRIASFILALVISIILFKPVSMFVINSTDWDDKLEQTIKNSILNYNIQENKAKQNNENVPKVMMEYINDMAEKTGNQAREVIAETMSKEITITIINISVIFILFIASKIILLFVKGLANLITKIPVIKQIDKAGGVVYGLLEALLVIYALLAVISFISPMLGNFVKDLQKSIIGNMMYNNNLILKFLL